jgi:hypothetical protein
VYQPLLEMLQEEIDNNIATQKSNLLVTVVVMELVLFFTLFTALPIYTHIRKLQNEVYSLFATFPGKNIEHLLN